jgi:DNA polymerase-1
MNYVFDIESDGLLKDVTRMWIMVVKDLKTGKRTRFLEGDLGWQELFNNANQVVGHNIINYDLPVLEKLFGYKLPTYVKAVDTLILSQILDYKRFGDKGHSLKVWGEYLNAPKQEFEDWSKYSETMALYCENDVEVNTKILMALKDELDRGIDRFPEKFKLTREYIKVEHAVAKWCADASLHGWPFDVDKAYELYDELETKMNITYGILNKKLGVKTVACDKKASDPVDFGRKPKFLKDGRYDIHLARWFNIDQWSGVDPDDRLVVGEYCKFEIVPLSLNSVADVKIFLYRNGWKPTDWNYKLNADLKREKTTPKITEDSLEFLGGDGKLYSNYLTEKARHSIVKTWLENVDDNNRLHGDCMVIGTPSMRSRHSIIVNIPSPDAPYGKQMRSLFKCIPGWKIVGCDSAGNQARGLAHFLKDDKFTDILLNGDVHTFNADTLNRILRTRLYIDWNEYWIGQGVKADEKHTLEENLAIRRRNCAKRVLYAFLFGASGGKLWSYMFNGEMNDTKGNKVKKDFIAAVPGFKELLTELETTYGSTKKTGHGYIGSLANTRLYVDSFHKLLVYKLQATEKITCGAACMLVQQYLQEEEIPYQPLIMYHDEFQFMVPEEHAERAVELGIKAFQEGPKLFGVTIMDGSGSFGNTWLETH